MKVLPLVLILILPAGAQAATIRTETGTVPQPYAGWIDHSKAPVPQVHITLMPGSWCPKNSAACMDSMGGYRIGMRLRSRFALMHEVGHVFDEEVMDAQGHREFLGLAKKDVGERFADAYGICAIWPRFDSLARWNPSPKTRRAACRVIRRAYGRFISARPVSS